MTSPTIILVPLSDAEIEAKMHKENHEKALDNTGFWGDRGAGAIFYSRKSKRFMLGYRSHEVLQPHTLGTFGGAIDGKEAIKAAIKREIVEETGYDKPFKLKALYVYKKGAFSYYNYIAIIDDEFTPKLNWENEDAPWMTLSEIQKSRKLHFGMQHLLKRKAPSALLHKLAQ
jgi:8-oxo-dGTP pyrophosphatase MutT (NUDIX family)